MLYSLIDHIASLLRRAELRYGLMAAQGAALAVGLVALLASVTFGVVTNKATENGAESPSLEQRISALTTSLEEASSTIAEIEQEVQRRQQLVSELEQKQKEYEALAELGPEQLEAVAQVLRAEIEQSRSFWQGVWGNVVVAVIVAAVFLIIGAALQGWRQRR